MFDQVCDGKSTKKLGTLVSAMVRGRPVNRVDKLARERRRQDLVRRLMAAGVIS